MNYRTLGKSGINASVVGFGCWAIGGWMWGGSDEAEAVKAIQAAIDKGMNLVDTAPMYGFGRSEEIVGKAIKDRRDKVVLATKCGLIWHKEQGDFHCYTDEKHPTKDGKYKISRCLAPEMIRYEVEQSLTRLKTDYIDLYQTHWQDSTTPITATMETLVALKEEGKIRAIGCSNTASEQLNQYLADGQLDVNQELYSMLDRKPEMSTFPLLVENKVSFLAYSSLGQGLLTGKIGPERNFEEGDQRNFKPRFSVDNRQRIQDMLETFQPIADKYRMTLGQLVIAWTLAQKGCTHALVGARTVEQVQENAGGGEIQLEPDDVASMNETLAQYGKSVV